jgi:single-stranded DNA-binding protein
MGSGVRTYIILEGPVIGEQKLKLTKTNQSVCNLGFPIDTSEQAGMEHKDYWLQSISFGGLADIIGKLDPGTQVHLEGHLNANRWLDSNGIEKATMHMIVEKGGLMHGLGQPVTDWVISRKKKEEKLAVKAPAAAPVTPAIGVNKQQTLEEARRYLAEHEQAGGSVCTAGDLGHIVTRDNEAAGPGVAGP